LSEARTTSRGLPLNFADAALLHHLRQSQTTWLLKKEAAKNCLKVTCSSFEGTKTWN